MITSCVVPIISWKFHENPLNRFSIILLTNTVPENIKIDPGFMGLTARSWKFVECSLFHVRLVLKISRKSIHSFFSVILLTDKDFIENILKNYVCKGLNIPPPHLTFPDCSMYFAQHILKISWTSVHAYSRNVANRQTNRQTYKPTEMKI